MKYQLATLKTSLIKKNLAMKQLLIQWVSWVWKQKSEEKAHAEMIAEAKAIKVKLEAEGML